MGWSWVIAAAIVQVAIIAGALFFAIREVQAQTPRNSRRHFGGV